MSNFTRFTNSIVTQAVNGSLTPVLSALNAMAKRNDVDAVVLSTGRDNPDSTDPTSVVIQHPNGETKKVYMGSRTVRKNDTVIVVGNRVL